MRQRLTLNNTKEEIYAAYQKLGNELRKQRFLNKRHKEHKKDIRVKKNKQLNTMSYKNFRMIQVLWGVNKRLEYLKGRYKVHEARGRKQGFNRAVGRMNKPYFKTENPARLMAMMGLMSELMGLRLQDCAFLLWANRYDYFVRNDFDRDMGDTGISYYRILSRLKKNGMVEKMGEAKEFGRFKFCLNAIGKMNAMKIDKFIKKIG